MRFSCLPGDLLERASVSESLLIQYTLQHSAPSALPGLKIAISSPGSPVRSQTISQPGQPKQPFPAAHAHFDSVKAAPRSGLRGKEKGKVMAREGAEAKGESGGEGQGEGQRRGKCRKVEKFGRNCNKVEKIQKISLSLALRIRLIKVKQWSLSSENTRQGLTTRDDWYFQPPSGLPWRREVI